MRFARSRFGAPGTAARLGCSTRACDAGTRQAKTSTCTRSSVDRSTPVGTSTSRTRSRCAEHTTTGATIIRPKPKQSDW